MNNYTDNIQAVGGESRKITKPKTEILALTEKAKKYLTEKRGLLPGTIEAYRLGCDKQGRIVIPFYDEKDELSLVKFRHAEGEMLKWRRRIGDTDDFEAVEGKSQIEQGGKGILLGSHLCDAKEGPLVICFGDYDAMSVAQDGIPNCVGLPFGDGGLDFIRIQWNFLKEFSEIIIYNDADDFSNPDAELRAKKKLDEMARRLGRHRLRIIHQADRHGTKDANELLIKKGEGFNRKAVENAEHYPVGIVAVADYEDEPMETGTPFGLSDIDRVTNGAVPGNLILISGDNEAGKTTNVLNFCANFIDEGMPVFLWSGEQRVRDIRYWFERIAAGSGFLRKEINPKTEFEYFFPIDEVIEPLRNWYRNFLFQYTKTGISVEEFFEAAEIAVQRYDCRVIVVDNLMGFTGGEGEGYYQAQGDFAQMLKEFAVKWNVAVILICHNKKEEDWVGGVNGKPKLPDKNSVEGSKKITNWADVLLQFYRVPMDPKYRHALENADAIVQISKSRNKSKHSIIRLEFDEESNRAYQMNQLWRRGRQFSWADGTPWQIQPVPVYSDTIGNQTPNF